MKTFNYKAIRKEGGTVEGEKMAEDKASLVVMLRKEGLSVVTIEEAKTNTWWKSFSVFGGSVKEQDKIVFAKNLGKMIGAGLPMVRSLEIMEKQAKNGKFKNVLQNLNDQVSKGSALSDAMENHPNVFSKLFVSMLRAGEESGNLTDSLAIVGEQMERTYLLKKKVKGAMMYPGVILSAMILIGVLMLMFVVPTLTTTFEGLGIDLPLSTRIVIGVSDFLRNNILATLFGAIAVFTVLGMFFRSARGQKTLDFVFLHTPVIKGITVKVNAARTARTLSSLLSSGVEYTTAVGITEDVIQNSYYKVVLKEAGEVIVKGGNISELFADNVKLYPLFVSEMSSVGEETGKLSEMLLEVAKFYEDEVEQKTKDMSTIIEPFLMILIGGAVGFFALSMMSPMYSLADKI